MTDLRQPFVLRTLATNYPSGFELHEHSHDWNQLLFAARGVMTLTVTEGRRLTAHVVPPTRSVWIPAGVEHRVRMDGRVDMRTLYFPPAASGLRSSSTGTLDVDALLRELILHAVELGLLRRDDGVHRALARLINERVCAADVALPSLPLPADARAARVADWVIERPHRGVGLDELGPRAGASRRTLERLFARETGLSFGRWRRRAIMLAVAARLGLGESTVEGLAVRFGYESTSALIAAFRHEIGHTPGAFARR